MRKTSQLDSRAGEALVAKCYHAQVTPQEGAISLFHLDSSREAIKATGDTATIGARTTTLAALAEDAANTP